MGVAVLLLPQLSGTDSFLTSPTLNIGGDSKNSLMWQNGGGEGGDISLCHKWLQWDPGSPLFGQWRSHLQGSDSISDGIGCSASVSTAWHALCLSAATGLREELAFLSLSFPPPNMNYNADSVDGVLMVAGRKMHCLTS